LFCYQFVKCCFPLDVREQMRLIERGVNQKEPRFINRAVRSVQALRKRLTDSILRKLILAYYPPSELVLYWSTDM